MKIQDPETLRQGYLALLAPHVPEPILAVGFLSPGGMVGSQVTSNLTRHALWKASPLASMLFGKKQRTTAARDRKASMLVAVGATGVHLFPFPTDGSAFAVLAAPDSWERSQIRVTADKAVIGTKVHVQRSTGETLEFEIVEGKHWDGFSGAMLDLLLAGVTV